MRGGVVVCRLDFATSGRGTTLVLDCVPNFHAWAG